MESEGNGANPTLGPVTPQTGGLAPRVPGKNAQDLCPEEHSSRNSKYTAQNPQARGPGLEE